MIYPNEIKAGEAIKQAYDRHKMSNNRVTIVSVDGKLQAGKTGSYKYGLRLISDNHPNNLRPIPMTALTTYSLTDLNNQLSADLQDLDDIVDVKKITKLSSNIKKENLSELGCLRGGIMVLDEGEYGLVSATHNKGESGRVEALIEYLIHTNESYFILVIGATNYSLEIADKYGDLTVHKEQVVIEPGDGYRGIEEMVNSNKFHDMNKVSNNGLLSKPVLNLLGWELNNNPFGIHMLRADDRKQLTADNWKEQLEGEFKHPKYNVEVFAIYSGQTDYDISSKLKEVLKLGRSKNVIIIVCGAMAAGYRMNQRLKKIIRFVLDTSSIHSTLVQGLIGRACGYDLDYMPTIISKKAACQTYLDYQNSIRGMGDFKPMGGKTSTHLSSKNEFVEFVGSKYIGKFDSIDEAQDYLSSKGVKEKISIASEDVKDKATIQKFKRRVAELNQLKNGGDANYLFMGWKTYNGKALANYTGLVFKDGRVELVAREGSLMTIHQTSTDNKSLYKESII